MSSFLVAGRPQQFSHPPNIRIESWNTVNGRRVSVSGLLDEQIPTRSGGYGGWTQISRPQRTAALEWAGSDVTKVTFGVIFDGWARGESVESLVTGLSQLALPAKDFEEPPTIVYYGPVPLAGIRMVISDLTFGEGIRDQNTGKRLRQQVTVECLEYIVPDVLAVKSGNKYVPGGTTKKRLYTVVKGDTLQTVAKKVLKNVKRWKEILALNPTLTATSTLLVGSQIWVPEK